MLAVVAGWFDVVRATEVLDTCHRVGRDDRRDRADRSSTSRCNARGRATTRAGDPLAARIGCAAASPSDVITSRPRTAPRLAGLRHCMCRCRATGHRVGGVARCGQCHTPAAPIVVGSTTEADPAGARLPPSYRGITGLAECCRRPRRPRVPAVSRVGVPPTPRRQHPPSRPAAASPMSSTWCSPPISANRSPSGTSNDSSSPTTPTGRYRTLERVRPPPRQRCRRTTSSPTR